MNESQKILQILSPLSEKKLDDVTFDNVAKKEWLGRFEQEYFREYFEEVKAFFKREVLWGQTIPIFRAIEVNNSKNKWLNHIRSGGKRRLGVYWSFTKDKAIPYYGGSRRGVNATVLIKARINQRYVNWVETIRANMDSQYGLRNYDNESEHEINLFKNTPIKVNKIFINGKPADIQNIKSIKFIA